MTSEDPRDGIGADRPTTEMPVVTPGTPCADERRHAALLVLAGKNVGAMLPLDLPEVTFGRDAECDVRLDDEGVSRRHARVVAHGEDSWVIEDLGSTNGTTVNGRKIIRHELRDGDRVVVGRTVLKFVRQTALDAEYQAQLYEMSVRDVLTRLHNRRFFDERLRAEVAYARRHRSLLALLLLDLDHFKQVNDTRGHLAGDRVLSEVAALCQQQVRAEDVLARYGGEEFAVLVRQIPPPGVMVLAERIRRAVEGLRVQWGGGEIGVTVSIGAYTMRGGPGLTERTLLDAADRLLYRAKAMGRNRTCADSAT